MLFDDTDLDDTLDACGAISVEVKLGGATKKTILGIYRIKTVFEGRAGELKILPSLQVKTSDIAGIDKQHHLVVNGSTFRMLKDPEPDNSGFSLIGLIK